MNCSLLAILACPRDCARLPTSTSPAGDHFARGEPLQSFRSACGLEYPVDRYVSGTVADGSGDERLSSPSFQPLRHGDPGKAKPWSSRCGGGTALLRRRPA